MKLLYKNLHKVKIEKLIINSLEQALYQAIVVVDGVEQVIWKDDMKTLLTRNLTEMREFFEHMDIKEMVLRHESPYDEMVGHPEKGTDNRLEVPLGRTVYTTPKQFH